MEDLVRILMDGKDAVSGEEIARRLGISRTAVWKQVQNLEEAGFKIASVHRRGYRIVSVPERTIVPSLVDWHYSALSDGAENPWEIRHFAETASTNDIAKKDAAEGFVNNRVYVTDRQTAGRGRLQRKWESEPGLDLTFSIAISADVPVTDFYRYTMNAGLAVHQAVKDLLPAEAPLRIKWPNDVYIGKRKLSGILSEMITEEGRAKSIIVGVGVNVNSSPSLERAVSVRQISGEDTDRNRLLARILERFEFYRTLLENGGFDAVFASWKAHLGWLGDPVRIDTGRAVLEGILVDVSPEGFVTLRRDGADERFYTGDLLV
jgi:BirA family biotin operon repressor/biotin-[acetyl-CoA-carboxylase] ligase